MRNLCLWVGLMALGWSSGASADYVYIDSVLGYRAHYVDGLTAASSQSEITHEAVRLAAAPEGWNLAALISIANAFNRFEGDWVDHYILNPSGDLILHHGEQIWWSSGGVHWGINGLPGDQTENFGFALNAQAVTYGSIRGLQFHTDDIIDQLGHNLGEPSGFGTIAGTTSGPWEQLGQLNWGTFGVTQVPEPSTALLLGIGLVGMAARRRV